MTIWGKVGVPHESILGFLAIFNCLQWKCATDFQLPNSHRDLGTLDSRKDRASELELLDRT